MLVIGNDGVALSLMNARSKGSVWRFCMGSGLADARASGNSKRKEMRSGFVGLLLVSSIASAQVPRIEAIDIVDYGIYESELARRIDDLSSASGGRAGVKLIKHKERTSTIQAHIGLQFGFRFYVEGAPTGAEVRLRSITRFPPQGMRNPNTQKTSYSDVYTTLAKIGSADFRGYAFDEDWEIVPGVWTFEFWEGDRKLVEQRFTVVKP